MLRERERERKKERKKERSIDEQDFQREREREISMREMSMREGEGDEGGDERESVKIDGDSKKKTKRWKSLKEMKEYLRIEYEKRVMS